MNLRDTTRPVTIVRLMQLFERIMVKGNLLMDIINGMLMVEFYNIIILTEFAI